MRPRLAPSATRMASSRRRPSSRASSRLPTLAQATTSTSADETQQQREKRPRQPPLVAGGERARRDLDRSARRTAGRNSRSSASAMICRSACACSSDTPGRRRPINASDRFERSPFQPGPSVWPDTCDRQPGVDRCADEAAGKGRRQRRRRSCSSAAFSRTLRPIDRRLAVEPAPPQRLADRPRPAERPARSSASISGRPRMMRAPSIDRYPPDTTSPMI